MSQTARAGKQQPPSGETQQQAKATETLQKRELAQMERRIQKKQRFRNTPKDRILFPSDAYNPQKNQVHMTSFRRAITRGLPFSNENF